MKISKHNNQITEETNFNKEKYEFWDNSKFDSLFGIYYKLINIEDSDTDIVDIFHVNLDKSRSKSKKSNFKSIKRNILMAMSKRIPMFQKLLKNLEDNEINLYEAIGNYYKTIKIISYFQKTLMIFLYIENENSKSLKFSVLNPKNNCLTNSAIAHKIILHQKTKKAMRSRSIAVNALNKMVISIFKSL